MPFQPQTWRHACARKGGREPQEASCRLILVPWRRLSRGACGNLKGGWGEPEWFFPNDVGRLYDKRCAGKAFRRLLKAAGLPGFRLYDLRHTYASLLLAAGAPITYVSAQLGHANPTTTLRYYAKWIPSKGRRWVEVLDGADLRADTNFGTRIWNQTGSAMRVVAQAA
jgi:integrase